MERHERYLIERDNKHGTVKFSYENDLSYFGHKGVDVFDDINQEIQKKYEESMLKDLIMSVRTTNIETRVRVISRPISMHIASSLIALRLASKIPVLRPFAQLAMINSAANIAREIMVPHETVVTETIETSDIDTYRIRYNNEDFDKLENEINNNITDILKLLKELEKYQNYPECKELLDKLYDVLHLADEAKYEINKAQIESKKTKPRVLKIAD